MASGALRQLVRIHSQHRRDLAEPRERSRAPAVAYAPEAWGRQRRSVRRCAAGPAAPRQRAIRIPH